MSIIDRIKRDAERRTEGKYLQLKDKEQVRLRFLQELDATRPGYDEKFGLAEYILVHSNPKNFKRSAACTLDTQGTCWACDQVNGPEKEAYKWKPKGKLFVNVLVKSPEGDKVKVLQQGMSDKHIFDFSWIVGKVFSIFCKILGALVKPHIYEGLLATSRSQKKI